MRNLIASSMHPELTLGDLARALVHGAASFIESEPGHDVAEHVAVAIQQLTNWQELDRYSHFYDPGTGVAVHAEEELANAAGRVVCALALSCRGR